MIPTVRINKEIVIQKHLLKGLKIYVKVNDKWYCLKLNGKDLDYLMFGIHALVNDYE